MFLCQESLFWAPHPVFCPSLFRGLGVPIPRDQLFHLPFRFRWKVWASFRLVCWLGAFSPRIALVSCCLLKDSLSWGKVWLVVLSSDLGKYSDGLPVFPSNESGPWSLRKSLYLYSSQEALVHFEMEWSRSGPGTFLAGFIQTKILENDYKLSMGIQKNLITNK